VAYWSNYYERVILDGSRSNKKPFLGRRVSRHSSDNKYTSFLGLPLPIANEI
jgi:hypothetical protein